MIFVTVGSQKFQFNRLLQKIDDLIEKKVIHEHVVAQIGDSDYKPKHYKYFECLIQEEFKAYITKSNLIITHAGTGIIITALKENKKVIAIPRMAEYSEHVDNHQVQIVDEFKEMNFLEAIYDIEELENAIKIVKKKKYNKYVSNTENILKDITDFIEGYN